MTCYMANNRGFAPARLHDGTSVEDNARAIARINANAKIAHAKRSGRAIGKLVLSECDGSIHFAKLFLNNTENWTSQMLAIKYSVQDILLPLAMQSALDRIVL